MRGWSGESELYSRPADKRASGASKRRNRTLLEGVEEELSVDDDDAGGRLDISCLRSMDNSE